MTDEEQRQRTEYSVAGLCKAIRENDDRELRRHAANLAADALTALIRLERNIGRIADLLDVQSIL